MFIEVCCGPKTSRKNRVIAKGVALTSQTGARTFRSAALVESPDDPDLRVRQEATNALRKIAPKSLTTAAKNS
jgi:hypothetical protein